MTGTIKFRKIANWPVLFCHAQSEWNEDCLSKTQRAKLDGFISA